MLKIVLRYGILAGLIVGIPMVIYVGFFARGLEDMGGMLPTYLVQLVALSMVFVGIKKYRDGLAGGTIAFGQALLVGLGISAVAGVLYVMSWEIAESFSKLDFATSYAQLFVDQAKAKGANAAELARAQKDAADFLRQYSNPMFRLPMTFLEVFPTGILVTLISAGVLRNPRVLPARTAA